MTLGEALGIITALHSASAKPLGVVLAGHNGSGKSTLWYREGMSAHLRMPLINADRMMLSILPEASGETPLDAWAVHLRDNHTGWMQVAQRGVQAFTAQAMLQRIPFAMETVFSHWRELPDGTVESKASLLEEMRRAGYFTLLVFVGLANANISAARVLTRVQCGGHAVPSGKLVDRFPRTQKAIRNALPIADAALMLDNSGDAREAYRICRLQARDRVVFDWRDQEIPPRHVLEWLDIVSPR